MAKKKNGKLPLDASGQLLAVGDKVTGTPMGLLDTDGEVRRVCGLSVHVKADNGVTYSTAASLWRKSAS